MALCRELLQVTVLLLLTFYEINGHNILEGVRNPDTGIDVAHLLNTGQGERKPASKIDRVLKILEGLQKQINHLKGRVEELHKLQADLNATKKECQNVPGIPYLTVFFLSVVITLVRAVTYGPFSLENRSKLSVKVKPIERTSRTIPCSIATVCRTFFPFGLWGEEISSFVCRLRRWEFNG